MDEQTETGGQAGADETTEEEDDEVVLICMPAMPKERPDIEGSALRECKDCRRPIWLAPTGQKMERERGAKLTCMYCIAEKMKEDPETKIEMPTPEQLEEVKRTLLWNQARRFRGKTDIV